MQRNCLDMTFKVSFREFKGFPKEYESLRSYNKFMDSNKLGHWENGHFNKGVQRKCRNRNSEAAAENKPNHRRRPISSPST